MVITGGPTAVAGASAKTKLCATPSPGHATAQRATGDGAVRTVVNRAPMEMTVTRDASVRMERPATTLLGNVVVHLDTREPCKLMSRYRVPQSLLLPQLSGLGSRHSKDGGTSCDNH